MSKFDEYLPVWSDDWREEAIRFSSIKIWEAIKIFDVVMVI